MGSQGWVRTALWLHLMVSALPGWLLEVVGWLCCVRGQWAHRVPDRPPTKAWKASPRLARRCSVASRGAWHGLAKEPAQLPPSQSFSWLCRQRGIAALRPPPLLVSFFFYEASSKLHATNILLEVCKLPGLYLSEQAAATPSPHPGVKVLRYECQGLRFCPASLHACSTAEQSPEKDQGSSQKLANPSLGPGAPIFMLW